MPKPGNQKTGTWQIESRNLMVGFILFWDITSSGLIVAVMRKTIYSHEQLMLQALLRQTREESGLRQAELASRLGKPQSFVSKYESGERRLDLVELRTICACLGLQLTVLVDRFEWMIATNATEAANHDLDIQPK